MLTIIHTNLTIIIFQFNSFFLCVKGFQILRDRPQISFPEIVRKTSFLIISGEIEVNKSTYIRLILEAKFGEDPLVKLPKVIEMKSQKSFSFLRTSFFKSLHDTLLYHKRTKSSSQNLSLEKESQSF